MKRYCSILTAKNKGPDQAALMRRLICAFVFRIGINLDVWVVGMWIYFRSSVDFSSCTSSIGGSKVDPQRLANFFLMVGM